MDDSKIIQEFRKDNTKSKFHHGGVYTKKFIKYNNQLLKENKTDRIVYSNDLIYNKLTKRLVNKSKYYKNNGGLRSKYNNEDFVVDGETFLQPKEYVSNKILPKIKYAESSPNEQTINIHYDKLNDNISYVLNKIRPKADKVYYFESDGNYYALNHSTMNKLRDILKPEFVYEEIYESGMAILVAIKEIGYVNLTIRSPKAKGINDGSFFSYTHNLVDTTSMKRINLDKYGVYHEVKAQNYDVNCLCKCFEAAGHDITKIKEFVKNQAIPMRKLGDVADRLGVYITLRKIEDKSNLKHYGDKTKPHLGIGLINKHYFLIEKIPFTSFAIKNFHKICDKENFNKIYAIQNGKVKRKNNQFITSYQAIKILMDLKDTHLKEIELCGELYKTNNYKKIEDTFTDLSYNDNISKYNFATGLKVEGDLKENKPRSAKDVECLDTYYFDFETTTRTEDKTATHHKPFCVFTDQHKYGFYGEECGKSLLDNLIQKHGISTQLDENGFLHDNNGNIIEHNHEPYIRLVAHNAGYDFRFILKYLDCVDSIEKGTGLMSVSARYYNYGKVIYIQIKDSLKMINMGLGKFGSAFGLDVKKEILPYDLYSEENVKKGFIPINECLKFVNDCDKDEYLENCKRWNCIVEDDINILLYAGEYCYMDCITLKQGYEKFAGLVKEAVDEDINDYISLASMAHNYLLKQGCYSDVLQIAGVPRAFIQKCVVGGRVMCSENKKSHHQYNRKIGDKKLADFDAVSLYPSAMARMAGFLKGKPKIIKEFQPDKYDGYFICGRVKNIKINYKFPCVSVMTDKGIRNFNNDIIGEIVYFDKVGLEDFINFQGGEIEFINGYYYDEGHNDKVNEVITYLFTQRLKYKAAVYVKDDDDKIIFEYKNKDEWKKSIHNKHKNIQFGNPIQMVFKEFMNSSYGKSYLKPIESDGRYIPEKDFEKFMDRNYNYIQEATKLANGKFYKVKVRKAIDNHFNNVHVGVEILSMSKRIMYEVMTLAEDNDILMTYSDTDSIHIDADRVDELSDLYKTKYNRELIGKQMGQFHTDFDLKGSVGDIVAVESIFLGKKCYCDKLEAQDKDGNLIYDYHIRMKGIPDDCIKYMADKEYDGDVMKIYKDLYDGKEITFDLLAVRPKFEFKKNMTIIHRTKFNRKLKF